MGAAGDVGVVAGIDEFRNKRLCVERGADLAFAFVSGGGDRVSSRWGRSGGVVG